MTSAVLQNVGVALLAGIAGATVASRDALREAQRGFQTESQLATGACAARLAKAGRRLVDSYDRAIESAKLNGDAARMKTLRDERTQVLAQVEHVERYGIRDPLAELLAQWTGAATRPDLPRDGLAAYFGFNEGSGTVTFDAISAAPVGFGAAEWVRDENEPALDFRKPAAVLTPAPIALGDAWSVVLRAKFPLETGQHTWASLLVGGVARHHVIVNRGGELGVFRDDFVSSHISLKDLTGWHTLVARALDGKTTFWIDGALKGTSNAAVTDPIQTIGNGPWSANGDAQNFGVLMDGFVVYRRALVDAEIFGIGNRGL